jgi:predicted Zn-dependent peptidase
VPKEEFQMVKNYLAGEMLRSFDGPIALSEIYLDLLAYGLDFDYYEQYFQSIKSINPHTVRDLANKYLEKDSFVEVIAGNLNL